MTEGQGGSVEHPSWGVALMDMIRCVFEMDLNM